jgi:hypothetical protein
MKLDESHHLNLKVIEHLNRRKPEVPPIAAPDSHPDPYWELGSHPEVVEHVWDILGATLPIDCRAIIYGRPGLIHPPTGIIFALAYGTAYVIRVPGDTIKTALKAGCTIERTWSSGDQTNLKKELGRGWIFGNWLEQEIQWLLQTYKEIAYELPK